MLSEQQNDSYNLKIRNNALLALLGILSGFALMLDLLAAKNKSFSVSYITLSTVAVAIVTCIIFFLVKKWFLGMIDNQFAREDARLKFHKLHNYTYASFLVLILGCFGVQFSFLLVVAILLFVLSQAIIWGIAVGGKDRDKLFVSSTWLSVLFLLSGFAAIIYQIVWQKVLFSVFGVNIESVTVIVSIFMLGLGTGSVIGGVLSEKFQTQLPKMFFIIECIIGIFGVFSIPLIKIVGSIVVNGSILQIAMVIGALLFIPTILMGATLPILVTYINREYKNIGKTVGSLYFFNTVGSAIACFITAKFLFLFFGKQASVIFAACFNFIVGFLVYRYTQKIKTTKVLDSSLVEEKESVISSNASPTTQLSFSIILILSVMTGYISLSQEILWFRAVSYSSGGQPSVFAFVLGTFLFGIALSSLAIKKICEKNIYNPLKVTATMLLISSIVYYFSMPLTAWLMTKSAPVGILMMYASVGLISFFIGGIFPLLCHYGITKTKSIGVSLAWLYFANIIGATLGPLFTGFVLMNWFSLEVNIEILSSVTLILSCLLWFSLNEPLRHKIYFATLSIGVLIIFHFCQNSIFADVPEKLQFKTHYKEEGSYKAIVQNRNGIVSVGKGNNKNNNVDVIYGGGVYDGQFSTDPASNSNMISRAYMFPAFHRKPEEMLEIGLSGGAWAKVISEYPDVKNLTIVDINPGYLDVIPRYPFIATILTNPQIKIIIDDGRRWLVRNPEKKFDFILMNTTFHWRDGATNLLSNDFLKICKSHLKENGVVYYNSTSSKDVVFTAANTFKYVCKYMNFVACSDSPFDMTKEERRAALMKFTDQNKPVFSEEFPDRMKALDTMMNYDISDKGDEYRKRKDLYLVSDDNMATEYKTGKSAFIHEQFSWKYLFSK